MKLKRLNGWNRKKRRYRTIGMVILLSALVLAGCGKGTGESGEMSADAGKDTEGQDKESGSKKESSEAPEYDYEKMFEQMSGQSVVTEEQAKEKGRIILTLQHSAASSWLQDAIDGFNRQSDDYYIRLEESGWGEALETCRDRMSVEIAAGRGPDIFTGDVFVVNESILKKGVVENLAPWMDAMGITDEKYFPAVRALSVEDKVYGISPIASQSGYWIQDSVLGSGEKPDIETLVEKVYAYPDQEAVWRPYVSSLFILDYFLNGSEDLWGMIDWEKGKCDFTGDMFAKMLEIAKRYADPEGKSEKGITGWYDPYWDFEELEQLKSEGKVMIDFPFDDGFYPRYSTYNMLMLNANSEHLDGALKFLEYLLGEGQFYCAEMGADPVNKQMYESYTDWFVDVCSSFSEEQITSHTFILTEEKVDEIRDYYERARYFPTRTDEILEIIYEEAESFFNGDKTREAVCGIIQNRVQLYLDER